MTNVVDAADTNYRGSYEKLVQHVESAEWREFGPISAFTTRLPIAIFNGVLVLDEADPGAVDEAIDWVAAQAVPYRVWARRELADAVDAAATTRRLRRDSRPLPGMVRRPAGPPAPAPGVSVGAVLDPEEHERFLGVLGAGGIPLDVARRLLPPTFAFDPDVRLFTATLDGRAVGTAIAIRTGDVSGVYNVGTLPDARRRGIGRAATWAAVDAGREWGCSRVVLQASEMGESLYRSMGFRTVVRYAIFRPPT